MLVWALAQAAAVAVSTPAPAAAPQGVTSYPPAFFVDAHPNTAMDMMGRLPGFTLDTGASVRGYEGAAGNVLIDGQRPATKSEGIDAILTRIPASQVARVDLIRGGAPGIDMQGKTVIANVIRKSGGGWTGLVHFADQTSTDGRGFWVLRLEGSGKVGPRAWEFGFDPFKFIDDGLGDGPRTEINANGSPRLLAHIHSQGWGTELPLTGAVETPFAGGRVRINARAVRHLYDSDELDTASLPDTHTDHDHQDDNFTQTELGARYNRALGARASTEIVALRQDKRETFGDDFRTPGDAELFHLQTTTAESILRGVLKFQQRPNLSWEAGAEGALNALDSITRFSQDAVPVRLPAADVHVEEKRGEAFVKAVWRPVTPVTIEAAVREEGSRISSTGDVILRKSLYFTKPRLALSWDADANTQVRLRFEREVGQLDFGAFVASTSLVAGQVTAGNPNLEPQQDWASEIAVERRFLGQGALVLTVRHLKITDVVDRAPFGAFDAPANIGAGTEDDAVANLTLPLDKLGLKGAQFRGNLTRRRSEVTDPTTGQKRGITALHPSDWDAHFSQPIGILSYGVDMFGGWQETYFRFNQIEVRKLGAYVTPFAEWKLRPDLSFRIELDNVFARGFEHTFNNFDGSRAIAPLDFVEERHVRPGRIIYLRVRKTFGN